ncbi:MAG: MFS transporter [Gammaproteobacteria bacterium]|nr:MFS transporter [Gammaproteobacteria bacterium]
MNKKIRMTPDQPIQTEFEPRRVPLHHVIAVFAGNGLEFYDFMSYAFFAVYIGETFFPSANPALSLLGSLGTFGLGFVTRPIGAMLLGPLGDRIGRKPVMLLTFSLMGIGIGGLCLTPSYARIGIAAPILVLLFRLIQGFALGGEVGPATAYMVEAAPPMRRGLYGAMQAVTADGAAAVAGMVGLALALSLSAGQLQSWGWRLALGLGALVIPFGLWMRARLPETLHTPKVAAGDAREPVMSIAPHLRIILLGLLALISLTIAGYTVNYMTTYALSSLHMSSAVAFGATIVTGTFSMSMDAGSGWLSDRFGRKPVMLIPMVVLLLLIIPAYWLMDHYRDMQVLYGASAVLSMLAGFCSAPIFTLITEQLPMRLRSGAIAIIYAFAISVFGGSTQFMETWLIKLSGSPLAPAFYWFGAMLLGILAVSLMAESAPVRLRLAGETQPGTG